MNGLDTYTPRLPDHTDSKVRQLLFRDSYRLESTSEIVKWWEQRRLPYNLAVGATGLVSLGFLHGLGHIGPRFNHGEIGPPFMAIVFFALLANVAYTSGWMAELLLRPFFRERTGTVGATLFRYGLAFSVGITSLPIGIAFLDFGIRMLKWIF